METKLIFLLGVLTFCVAAPSDVVESSTSTSTSMSVSVSTVTRKVTSRSFSRPVHQPGTVPNDGQPTTEDMLRIQAAGKHSGEEIGDAALTKPQKIKKKILASNLKNASEKVVFPGDKHEKTAKPLTANVTEATDGGKPNSSDSAEDDILEDVPPKIGNGTQVPMNGTSVERSRTNGAAMEGRSLEDRSSEENVNVNPKAKTKVPATSTTSRTTSDYSYEGFGGLQKVLNNNYLNNNEGYEKGAAAGTGRPSPPATLPAKKSPPISRDNSLKNAIRFESEYYGPTGQTEWVPIIPDKLPIRHPEGGAHFGTKVRPPLAEKSNRTTERNPIVFPSDGVQPSKDSNAIPVHTTTRVRNNGPARITTISDSSGRIAATTEEPPLVMKHPTNFRGAVRYRSNSTVRFQTDTAGKRNMSLEVPATGALGGSPLRKQTAKPVVEETTEISVVSSTNHTTKFQNAVDGGVVVPPENVKVGNVTKEPPAKTPAPDDGNQNKTEPTKPPLEVIKGNQEWLPIKVDKIDERKNDTDLLLQRPVPVHQRNESVMETARPSTTDIDTTSESITEQPTATETTPELTTLPKLLSVTTESPAAAFDSSSHTAVDDLPEPAVTVAHADDGFITTTVESATIAKTSPIPSPIPTTLREGAEEADTDTPTESQPATVDGPTESEAGPNALTSTQRPEVETSQVTQIASTEATHPVTDARTTASTAATAAATIPKLILRENVTSPPTTSTEAIHSKTTVITEATSRVRAPSSTTTTTTAATTATPSTTKPPPTTSVKNEATKSDVTEEGIYYKNYIPTTINPHVDITEENVPAYLRLTVQARDWEELCRLKEDLRDSIMKMLGGKNVSADSVHFLNLNDRHCQEKIEETRGDAHNGTIFLPVNMFLMDRNGDFDKNLSEAFLTLWGRRGLDFELPIRKVDFVTPIVNLTELAEPPLGGSVVAAIVISCVAGICVILLGVLFVIMKRRQKRFNYGQRCTPVSLDAYSLDSVSIYNSVRRKGVRASKRSYGNAAFDDPEVPTHPMNFAGLANFSSDKDQLHEEFNIIPQVYPKVEELPAGAETKNRYANIIPLPETRVHLTLKEGVPLSDYINANYVRGLKGAEKLYIACQAPMESTVEDFWRMIWEQQCKVILMVTDLQENGIEKCADYLPPNEVTDNLRLFGDFQVTLKKRDVKEKYIISNLKLKNMEANLWREVTHLWYLGWPDQGVPSEANSLIAFLIEARSQMKMQNGATTSSPVVVHCSPGTGRTGTVIACDLCIREYEQSRMVDIPRCVFNLRRDRAGAVQTKDQYAFIYQVLNVYATKLSGGGIESI